LVANELMMDAFYTDVRPRLAQWRTEHGLPANPMTAFAESGYQTTIDADRVGGTQSSWGA
jgi:L-rhamnose isomerase/sugar isomerase